MLFTFDDTADATVFAEQPRWRSDHGPGRRPVADTRPILCGTALLRSARSLREGLTSGIGLAQFRARQRSERHALSTM